MLLAKSTMGNPKIIEMRHQNLPLRHLDAKIDLKILILFFRNIIVTLGQIDNGEYKNHGAETSGPTLETPGSKN